ncbi:TRAP transporter small permease [Jiella avicenniae]|uniref:TRAP transporter small permease protein n=1 Tax=Jiella avicenniae TaxID=2907202 RepID=A0A9X1P4H8_9HYPH|nr:TRAP transporter small permease [Jiella avicenniae]MCE7029614.1 TRAP transporter small permease subunit [Jiella avicenniae]
MTTSQDDGVRSAGSAGRVFDLVATLVRVLAGGGLVALACLVLAEVVSRAFGRSLNVVEELAGYVVVAVTFLGAALAFRDQVMFRVGFVFDALPGVARRALTFVYLALSLGVSGVLIWQTIRLVQSSYSRGKFAPTELMTPLYIPQLLLPVGLSVIALFLLERAIIEFRGKAGD